MERDGKEQTLHAVLQEAYRAIDVRAALVKNISLSEEEFLGQIFRNIDTRGTALEKSYSVKREAVK